MAGGVERSARQQSLRHPEPVPRVDLRTVGEGPLGAVCVQPAEAGQPSQALPHRAQLRLALRLHTHADAHAPGGPQVGVLRPHYCELKLHFHHSFSQMKKYF